MSESWSWKPGPPPFLVSADPGLSDAAKERMWHRGFWGAEASFAVVSTFNPRDSDMILSCNIDLPPERGSQLTTDEIRRATRALRWSHPSIATTCAFPPFTGPGDFRHREGVFLYQAPAGEEDVKAWLDDVVVDKSSYLAESKGDFDQALENVKMDIGAYTTPTSKWPFMLYYLGDNSINKHAVVLYASHVLTDGCGMFEALDLWLNELAHVLLNRQEPDYHWGEEHVRLAKAVPDRVDKPESVEPLSVEHPTLKAMIQAGMMPPPQFGLPIPHPHAQPTYTGTIVRTLLPPIAEHLRLAARAHGCTVFSAILSASFLTLIKMSEGRTTKKKKKAFEGELGVGIAGSPFDLRSKYLSGGGEVKKDRSKWQIVSALASGGLSLRRLERFIGDGDDDKMVESVWTLAREIQEQVAAQAPSMATASYWLPIAIERMISAFNAPRTTVTPSENRIIGLSSMGVMDDSLSPTYPVRSHRGSDSDQGQNEEQTEAAFKISNPIFSGNHPGLPSGNACGLFHPYTWQGTLYLSVSFPSAFMGSVEEQKRRDEAGEGTLYGWVGRVTEVLQKLAGGEQIPN